VVIYRHYQIINDVYSQLDKDDVYWKKLNVYSRWSLRMFLWAARGPACYRRHGRYPPAKTYTPLILHQYPISLHESSHDNAPIPLLPSVKPSTAVPRGSSLLLPLLPIHTLPHGALLKGGKQHLILSGSYSHIVRPDCMPLSSVTLQPPYNTHRTHGSSALHPIHSAVE